MNSMLLCSMMSCWQQYINKKKYPVPNSRFLNLVKLNLLAGCKLLWKPSSTRLLSLKVAHTSRQLFWSRYPLQCLVNIVYHVCWSTHSSTNHVFNTHIKACCRCGTVFKPWKWMEVQFLLQWPTLLGRCSSPLWGCGRQFEFGPSPLFDFPILGSTSDLQNPANIAI